MTQTLDRTSALASRQGKAILALLCAVAFLDFVDASIVNVALPSIRDDLHFSVQGLQWIPSGYLLTYGGFMLLGGRAAATKRHAFFDWILVSIGVDQLDFAGHDVGAMLDCFDCYLSHRPTLNVL